MDLLNGEKRLKYLANPNRLKEELLANLKYSTFVIDEIQKALALLDVLITGVEQFLRELIPGRIDL